MKNSAILIIVLVAGVIAPLDAQGQNYVVTLAEAQAVALEKAFAMQYAALDRSKAERDVKGVLASGLPQVNLIADYSQYIDIPTQVAAGDVFGFPEYLTSFLGGVSQATGVSLNQPPADPDALSEFQFGQAHTANVGIQASQLVFSGSYFVGLRAAQLYVDVQDRAAERTADEVLTQVAEAYHLALGAEEALSLAQESVKLIEQSRSEVSALQSEGFADALSVDRLNLAKTELEAQVMNAERQVALTKGLLAFQMGIGLQDELTLADDLETLLANGQELEWMSRSFDPSAVPAIQEQQMYFELAGLDVMNQKAKGWPQIGAFYTNQGNAQRDAFNFLDGDEKWYPVQLWGLNMSMPLWTSFGGKQLVEKKKIEQERARIGLGQLTQAAEMEFGNARAGFANATAVLNNARTAEAIAGKIYSQTEIGFNEGVVSSFEWTESRNELLQARSNRLAASLNWLNARVALQATLSAF
jgi:outer membrane protein TolC